MTMATAARPSAAHMDCLIRNRYALWFRSWAIMADALYTITMLANTRSSVAKNSTLSDFSFRAIVTRLLTAPAVTTHDSLLSARLAILQPGKRSPTVGPRSGRHT